MTTTTVKEGCSAWLQVTLKDKTGALAIPTATRYRIDCMTTGAIIKDWTVGPASSAFELALSATDNVMQSENNAQEQRRVTVEASYGSAADKATDEFDFTLVNLSGV
jgi:hypothetical protein